MTDFVIVGGGIAGLSAAARLAPLGDVTLLEAEDSFGYHASGRSAALLETHYGAPSVCALSEASVDFLRTHDGGYLSERGMLLIAKAEQGMEFERDCASMALDEISVQQAQDLVPVLDPDRVAFAAFHRRAKDIDTHRLLQAFSAAARQNGATLLERRKVDAISKAGKKWRIGVGEHVFLADVVVNAAGAWADSVAALAGVRGLGIVPHRRSMARIPAPDGHDVAAWPAFFGVGESWYAKPDAGLLLVSPADEDPVAAHDAWADEMTLAQGIARYEDMVTHKVMRIQSSWAGLRSFAPDRTLVLGPDPEVPGFVWCAAQGGYGIQTAPAASQLLADLIAGQPPSLPEDIVRQLTPDRLT